MSYTPKYINKEFKYKVGEKLAATEVNEILNLLVAQGNNSEAWLNWLQDGGIVEIATGVSTADYVKQVQDIAQQWVNENLASVIANNSAGFEKTKICLVSTKYTTAAVEALGYDTEDHTTADMTTPASVLVVPNSIGASGTITSADVTAILGNRRKMSLIPQNYTGADLSSYNASAVADNIESMDEWYRTYVPLNSKNAVYTAAVLPADITNAAVSSELYKVVPMIAEYDTSSLIALDGTDIPYTYSPTELIGSCVHMMCFDLDSTVDCEALAEAIDGLHKAIFIAYDPTSSDDTNIVSQLKTYLEDSEFCTVDALLQDTLALSSYKSSVLTFDTISSTGGYAGSTVMHADNTSLEPNVAVSDIITAVNTEIPAIKSLLGTASAGSTTLVDRVESLEECVGIADSDDDETLVSRVSDLETSLESHKTQATALINATNTQLSAEIDGESADRLAGDTNVRAYVDTQIANIRSDFQAGVTSIYNSLVAAGVTPSAATPAAINAAINNMHAAGTLTAYKIGSATYGTQTFDLSSINGYQSFDINNFIVDATAQAGQYAYITGTNIGIPNASLAQTYGGASTNTTKSYDASTGTLTITIADASYGTTLSQGTYKWITSGYGDGAASYEQVGAHVTMTAYARPTIGVYLVAENIQSLQDMTNVKNALNSAGFTCAGTSVSDVQSAIAAIHVPKTITIGDQIMSRWGSSSYYNLYTSATVSASYLTGNITNYGFTAADVPNITADCFKATPINPGFIMSGTVYSSDVGDKFTYGSPHSVSYDNSTGAFTLTPDFGYVSGVVCSISNRWTCTY